MSSKAKKSRPDTSITRECEEYSEHGLYSRLPTEVTRVAGRIGLSTNVSAADINKVLDEYIEAGTSSMGHQAYNLKKASEKTTAEGQSRAKIMDKAKRVKNKLTSKERKKLFDLKKSKELKYSIFIQINRIWNGYIESVLSQVKCPADELKLIRADYHGALFVVTAARNPALIGLKGIVFQETKILSV